MEYIRSEHYDHVRNGYGRELVIPSEKEWAEVKRGRWEEKERFTNDECEIDEWQSARCSMCGKYHTTPYMYYFDNYKFCPNCGAKMEDE